MHLALAGMILLATGAATAAGLDYTKIVENSEGVSSFTDGTLPLEARPDLAQVFAGGAGAVEGLRFLQVGAGVELDFHASPRRQWVLILSGTVVIGTGDGDSRTLGAGSILWLEDVEGRGHSARFAENTLMALVPASTSAGHPIVAAETEPPAARDHAPVEDAGADPAPSAAATAPIAPTPDSQPPARVVEGEPAEAGERAVPAEPAEEAEPARTLSGLVLVGSFGTPFSAAEETGIKVQDALAEAGVETRFFTSAAEALRGDDAVLALLIKEAREAGADSVLWVRSRWGFREFVQISAFRVADGSLLWKEKVTGGLAHRSEEITPVILDKALAKLAPRIGGPGLPVSQ